MLGVNVIEKDITKKKKLLIIIYDKKMNLKIIINNTVVDTLNK